MLIEHLQQIAKLKKVLSKKMKKLLDIIKLDPLNECYQLELDFKTERRNIKRYLKSLKELKSRVKVNHQYFANLTEESSKIVADQEIIKKKNSELDYFMVNGVKPLKAFNLEGKKLQNFYEILGNQVKDLVQRLVKYLDQSKESYSRVSKEHQKVVKEYAQKCFPETGTILFMIGFTSSEKIKKVDDTMKQQSVLKETEMYIKILNTYIDQMQELKSEASNLFRQHYLGATELWINCCEDLHKQMNTYRVDEDEVEDFFKETGGAYTDRSDRSSRSNPQHQQEI